MFKEKAINLKIIWDRAKTNLAAVNFLMIMYLFILETPYPFWMVLPIAGLGVFILGYTDYKFVLPREHNRQTELNPFMVEVRKDVKEIKNMLKKKEVIKC